MKNGSILLLLAFFMATPLNSLQKDPSQKVSALECNKDCQAEYGSILSEEIFTHLDYSQILTLLHKIEKLSPEIIQLSDAFKLYDDLNPLDCGPAQCEFPIVSITNFNSIDLEKTQRPQIFLIGSIHGDEVVGSQTLTYLIKYFHDTKHTDETQRILNNYQITLLPMANPWAYYRVQREEKGFDPNRFVFFETKLLETFLTTAKGTAAIRHRAKSSTTCSERTCLFPASLSTAGQIRYRTAGATTRILRKKKARTMNRLQRFLVFE
jgi:hypothetical protein